ncbi:cell division protein ZapA [unidentified bacterial endosymbiont]|uniref:cell division protein ZapA n=1 Tax=unidentified bacterial endosymbiont TaxID=2355 RepID=UPI002646C03F|nr:cell division protein ZapA [unidentified bacterial endosymbiont]
MVSIQILGRKFTVNCPVEEQADLQQAVINLNERLQDLKQRLKVVNSEQLVMVVALNLCNELLQSKQRSREQFDVVLSKTGQLQKRLEQALMKTRLVASPD